MERGQSLVDQIIKTFDLAFGYSDETGKVNQVFKDLNLSINTGQLTAILGHNGSGKSTLAKHFNAVLIPEKGKCLVLDMDTADYDKIYDIRSSVGMVFQNPDNQIVATIVEEDVAFALENMGVEPQEIRSRVDEALKTVGMYEFKDHAPHLLSGGQKQRIAIAGIIAMRPKCILLDEPTAMLDPRGRQEVMSTVKMLKEKYGITVVIITHYMDEAAMCDRVVVMDKGQIILDDIPSKVFSHISVLKEVGLDVPQTTELIYELRKAGYNLPEDIISEEQCIEAVLTLFKK